MAVTRLMLCCLSGAGAFSPQEQQDPPTPPAHGNQKVLETEPEVETIIQGQVVDALGRGIEGRTIQISKVGDPSVGGEVRSDPYGDFTLKLPGAHPGAFKINIAKVGFIEYQGSFDIDEEDLEPFIDFMLQGALSLVGDVVEFLEGHPVGGADVRLQTLYRNASVKADASGHFEFKNLILGPVEIRTEAPGYGRAKTKVKIGLEANSVSVVLKPEKILHLTLLDEKDRPVKDAAVEIEIADLDDYRSGLSDAAGQVTFKRLPFDCQVISVRLTHREFIASGRYDRRVSFAEDRLETRQTLLLEPAGSVRGRITQIGTDAVLNGARIDIGEAPDFFAPHAFSNISGSYEISGLEPGQITVTVIVAGHVPELKTVQIRPRETATVDFSLGQGRTITARVIDTDGKPVAGAEIEAMSWRGFRTLRMPAQSDHTGSFALFNAPNDEFKVSIYAPGAAALIDQMIAPGRNNYEFTLQAATGADGAEAFSLCKAKVGDRCPPLKLKTLGGAEINDQTAKGKILLIDFWATWCGPCVAEIPTLQRIQGDFGSADDFLLISISSDMDRSTLQQFIEAKSLSWPQVHGVGSGGDDLAAAFGVRAIPCTIIVGRDGKIAAVGLIGAALHAKIKETLDKKTD